jgi:thymidylate kinase
VLVAVEGIAGSGKSTLRDHILRTAAREAVPMSHVGQFSWLSLEATRVIVALRAGRTPLNEATALDAVHHDLTLHARHILAPARNAGHVLADRHTLSSACLLALLYQGPVERYLARLATIDTAIPRLTVLLTTPTELCLDRVRARPTHRRFGEHADSATRLADLYERAAESWQHLTGQEVLRRPAIDSSDTHEIADEIGAHMRADAPPAATNWEA